MSDLTIIGIDLAKRVFQLHGTGADGQVIFRKKLTRPQFKKFMAGHGPTFSQPKAGHTTALR